MPKNGGSGKALVLGGGGVVGIAWETGLLAGLAEGGFDASGADVMLGSSAGSTLCVQLARRLHPEQIAERRRSIADDASSATLARSAFTHVDPDTLGRILAEWAVCDTLDASVRQELGRQAVEAAAAPESVMLTFTRGIAGGEDWPDPLYVTAVDADTGEFVVFSGKSGVSPDLAVAASCSVPGIFSPVTIGDRRFVDGGLRSGTNADHLLPLEPERMLIVSPLSNPALPGLGPLMDQLLRRELELLREAGVAVHVIEPSEKDLAEMGPNPMDPGREPQAEAAGLERGRSEAAAVLGALGAFA